MKSIILAAVLLLISCGSEGSDCHGSYTMIAGDHTEAELHMVAEAMAAFASAGYEDPGYFVIFVHEPTFELKGVTWQEFRVPGAEPRDPAQGYNGWCDLENCLAYVRTSEKSYETVRSDLIHELVHALGYNHGQKMKAAEKDIKARLGGYRNVQD